MNANIPVLALSVIGVLLAAAGIFVQQSIFLVGGGIVVVLVAWLLQELARRRS
jgi:hypothetical protein